MFCRKCGTQIPDDSEFCFKCGAPTAEKPAEGNSKLWDYNDAVNKMNSAKSFEDFERAEKIFEALGDYKDSEELLIKCRENKIHTIYDNAVKAVEAAKSIDELDEAEKSFEYLGDYENSRELAEKCREKKIPLIYDRAVDLMNAAQSGEDFQKAAESFRSISDHNNSDELLKKCEYNQRLWIYNDGYKKMNAAQSSYEFKEAAEIFKSIPGFEDSGELEEKCLESANLIIYNDAVAKMDNAQTDEEFSSACELFGTIKGYKNANDLAEKCEFNKKALIYNDALEKLLRARYDFEFEWVADKMRALEGFPVAEQVIKYIEQSDNLLKYRKAVLSLECSSDIKVLENTKKKFLSLGDFAESPQLANECDEKIDSIIRNVHYEAKRHDDVSASSLMKSIPEKVALLNSSSPAPSELSICPNCGADIIVTDTGCCPYCHANIERKEHGGSVTESSPISLEKSSSDKNSKSVKCPNCGAELIAPESGFCPYCYAVIDFTESSDISLKKSVSDNAQKSGATVHAAPPAAPAPQSSNTDTRQTDSPPTSTAVSPSDEIQKCPTCGTVLHSWNSRCPKCGTQKPGAEIVSAAPRESSFEEDYASLKIGSSIVIYIIMGFVFFCLLGTGNIACAGCDRYAWTPTATYVMVGSAIGLAVLRGIILLIYKATHKM